MARVYVVHCIDTEGPLYEPLTGTFERVRQLTGVEVPPSRENLQRIQAGTYPLDGYEEMAKLAFSARFLNYNSSWTELEKMLECITGEDFRKAHGDSYGNGWCYTFFVNDFVDFTENPRERCIGYHAIWDHYHDFYELNKDKMGTVQLGGIDEFQWHTHAMTFSREAHRNAVSLRNSPHVWEVLARRIIDRGVFPECFRAGLNAERPDWNYFLEQYIPFDFSNQAFRLTELDKQQGLSTGRFGDWRRAPMKWQPYHPSYDDYQVQGNCRRWIFRCLNVGTRLRFMRQADVDEAFAMAASGQDVVLAFMDHDFRNIIPDIDETHEMLECAANRFPNVNWEITTASKAARKFTGGDTEDKLDIRAVFEENRLEVEIPQGCFGPQPFLAIKTKGRRYLTDDFDFENPFFHWTYTFDEETVPLADVEAVGIAANGSRGGGALCVLDTEGNVRKRRTW